MELESEIVGESHKMTRTKKVSWTVTGVAQLVGRHPAKQKVAGSVPSQGTGLDCGFGPQVGAYEKQLIHVSLSHRCLSPSLSSSLPLSFSV